MTGAAWWAVYAATTVIAYPTWRWLTLCRAEDCEFTAHHVWTRTGTVFAAAAWPAAAAAAVILRVIGAVKDALGRRTPA